MADVFWVLWFAGCLLIAYWLIRAARDYRDTDPQPHRHSVPAAPDNMPGQRDDWAALCEQILALPTYYPNHRTTKGD